MKATQTEIKQNIQGTKVKGRKPGLKSMIWNRKKKYTFNQNRMKKQEFRKMRRGLGTSGTTLNIPTSESYGVPEREEEEQQLENLFEKK